MNLIFKRRLDVIILEQAYIIGVIQILAAMLDRFLKHCYRSVYKSLSDKENNFKALKIVNR